ncbi:PP2C family protein-serine/threonine phosphatase [Tuwongella immobilis]|nr:PP2C family protein-serine/threonine phosphatase [Tuwongella immobilis]
MSEHSPFTGTNSTNWRARLAVTLEMMRELSRHQDPDTMSRMYSRRMRQIYPIQRSISFSRRGLEYPWFRITRDTAWTTPVNPWKEPQKLPLMRGGLLAELIYSNEPQVFGELELAIDDPAKPLLAGYRSAMAIPHFDNGDGLNMVILLNAEADVFEEESLPDQVWLSNLFGRATFSLVLSDRLRDAYEAVDHELRLMADLQQSLLPPRPKSIPGLDFAVHYQTAKRAGGDYYDLIPLSDGRWVFLIGDVSGHGPPAAVLMAVTHALVHRFNGPPDSPNARLSDINNALCERYTGDTGSFVTMFMGVYDPVASTLRYASAGHNPPRVVRCRDGSHFSLANPPSLPLGILPDEDYPEETLEMVPGDQLILYTDGVTESMNRQGEQFGPERLSQVLANCPVTADHMLAALLHALQEFTQGEPAADDRTLMVFKRK